MPALVSLFVVLFMSRPLPAGNGVVTSVFPARAEVVNLSQQIADEHTGTMSWYRYNIGDWTNEEALTCASRDFPRYSWVRISYKGMSIECKITDYIEHPDRIIDASPRVFKAFAPLSQGLVKGVVVEAL